MTFQLGPGMPDFMSVDAKRIYTIGKYHALLIVNPPTLGSEFVSETDKNKLKKYLYAMVVFRGDDLLIIITSEITSNLIISAAPDNIKAELRKPSLCVLNADKSWDNFGKDEDWTDIDVFSNKCLDMIAKMFNEKSTPVLMANQTSKSASSTKKSFFDKIRKWHFGKLLVLISIYLMMFIIYLIADLGWSEREFILILLAFLTLPLATIIWIWLTGRESR